MVDKMKSIYYICCILKQNVRTLFDNEKRIHIVYGILKILFITLRYSMILVQL